MLYKWIMTLPAVNNLPSIDILLATLQCGGVVITSTQRLARHLTHQVSLHYSDVIAKPDILSIESWLIGTWSQIEELNEDPRRLLSTAEASELWRRVIEDHTTTKESFSLLQSESAARLAASCRVALKTHSVSMAYEANRRLFQSEIDTKNFLSWLDVLDARLVRERWLLLEDTYEIIARGAADKGSEVLFLSEEAPGPALSGALSQCFNKCTWHHSKALDMQLETHAFETRSDELEAAAYWGKSAYDAGLSAVIVLTDYQRDRAELEQCLRQQFEVDGQSFTQLPVNFSRGVELSKTPIYRDFLLLMRLLSGSVSREDIVALIRSPFFYWSHRAEKAKLIRALFGSEEKVFSAPRVLSQLNLIAPHSGLTDAFNWARIERLVSAKHPASQWRELLTEFLNKAGWPGSATLDSVEYQQYEQFADVLDTIEVNPLDRGAFPLSRFVEKLNHSLSQRIFQPQTESSQLQVMFLRDTFGLPFDAVRVVGAVSESLPGTPQLLSLIPWQICRDYHIRSVFEHESESISRRLLGRLSEQADLTLSFPLTTDGLETLPSRFCAEPRPITIERVQHPSGVTLTLEEVLDDIGCETITPLAQKGGAGLLEDQALCPLKAHLKHRLGISALREEQIGLSAAERGAVLHAALFHTFEEVGSSEHLARVTPHQQGVIVDRSVEKALSSINAHTRDRVGLAVIDLERMRLQGAVIRWLEIESKRSIPFEVIAREVSHEWETGGMSLSFKIDRVDQLADGGRVIIDYKSKANNSLTDWTRIPIKAPQLPSYSEVIDDVVSVAIASVTSDNPGYRPIGAAIGVGRSDAAAQKEMEDKAGLSWPDLRVQWRGEIDRLVTDFISGSAVATPSARACRYCDYAAICRAKVQDVGDDGEEADVTAND